MITMAMMMNVIDDDDNGHVRIMINPKGSDEDVVGMTNIFIENSSHHDDNDDDINIDDNKKYGDDVLM